jgi:hypothetical protein
LLVVVDDALFSHVCMSDHVGGQAAKTLVVRRTNGWGDVVRVRGVEVSDGGLGLRDLAW